MIYSQYDEIAKDYDKLFLDRKSLVENAEVGEMLPPLSGKVLDIGCGTGILTEIKKVNPRNYIGIDPSMGMLKCFIKKHPKFSNSLINKTFEESEVECDNFDVIVSLFGSVSYLSAFSVVEIANSKARKFLMFYKKDYHPITYEKCNVEFTHYCYPKGYLERLFGKENISEYHNYIIVNV